MSNSKGQTLLEFVLVFAVLLMATSGTLILYKKFWKSKYKKVSMFSGITASALKISKHKVSYVK
ncbi:MAG: hypothetical protein LBD57_02365 [Endomicrobium sp.]|jgi:uncharacterized protein (UPF0333 family)|uniref:hypothetical protein n=1 Tax=Candidatus Endomicrobiellum cubanum TaxID=3242325 RepID=UPI00281CB47A|nr:hypothetical protein [Endomicrobium sp.]